MDRQKFEFKMTAADIRPTPVRTLILGVLSEANNPVSSLDIEMKLLTVDRSSITRSLALFVEKGLVHIVDDGSGALKYEPCNIGIHNGHLDDSHPHFHCIKCGTTVCLNNTHIPAINLPEGYIPLSVNYVIKGFCPQCSFSDRK